MEVKSLKCPECGGTILVTNEGETTFCSHCGTKLYLTMDKNHKKYSFSFNEKIKLQELQLEKDKLDYQRNEEERKRIRKEEKLERKRTSIMTFRILRWTCVILLIACFFVMNSSISYEIRYGMRAIPGMLIIGYVFLLIISLVNRFL